MFISLRDAVAADSGGKAGALGALLRAGMPVPEGFVVPFDTHRLAVRDADLTEYPFPAELFDELAQRLNALGDMPVAVRSSADNEDTAQASGAGQHDSILAVRGTSQVIGAIRTCWGSLHSTRAVSYRESSGTDPLPGEPMMAVIVQRLVDADVSGVMFTPDVPEGPTEIEASWGLGPSVVGGTVIPDSYRVAANGSIDRTISDKRTRIDRAGSRLVTADVPNVSRNRPTLKDETITRLVRLGHTIATALGGPQDIEWAIADDHVWVLQARPITAVLSTGPVPAPVGSSTMRGGTPGSQGTVTGSARTVRGPADFARVHPGDILICPYTDPSWTPLLRIAAGVVTENGGMLCHAAIVARELGIPAVLGVSDATELLQDGTTITLDGAAGTITTATN